MLVEEADLLLTYYTDIYLTCLHCNTSLQNFARSV